MSYISLLPRSPFLIIRGVVIVSVALLEALCRLPSGVAIGWWGWMDGWRLLGPYYLRGRGLMSGGWLAGTRV
ncbi:hypothetical protein F4779DRAFT_344947 [Xylariaceae sp. FL0662B]|nr:hypothetical protein F4779DRAFT_344947 [Xylariaceae sp. FL0662B]